MVNWDCRWQFADCIFWSTTAFLGKRKGEEFYSIVILLYSWRSHSSDLKNKTLCKWRIFIIQCKKNYTYRCGVDCAPSRLLESEARVRKWLTWDKKPLTVCRRAVQGSPTCLQNSLIVVLLIFSSLIVILPLRNIKLTFSVLVSIQ